MTVYFEPPVIIPLHPKNHAQQYIGQGDRGRTQIR